MVVQIGNLVGRGLQIVAYGAVGAAAALIVLYLIYLDGRPDLQPWHEADLDQEFSADGHVDDFSGYLALERRLFEQLDQRVYARVPASQQTAINRYHRGSLADPSRWPTDWNRSFELIPPDPPRCGVLLLHGMSDSPYSLRSLGLRLQQQGAYVLGLRLPGHGTAPSGLVDLQPKDLERAVRIGMRQVAAQSGDGPIYVVGYSTGAALAVLYALDSLTDPALPRIDRMVLLSPAIGVSPVAALAVWQARLGHLLGLDKVAWNALLPEYDPFKYGSFAVNAGDVVYRLTKAIQGQLTEAEANGGLAGMPPILAFSSVVDATVSTPALVRNLFERLPRAGHELVLFDINRAASLDSILAADPAAAIRTLQTAPDPRFVLSVVGNASPDTAAVVARRTGPGIPAPQQTELGLSWPDGVYSLSHVALPFPSDDPLYGGDPQGDIPLHLGNIALRGERGVLLVSAADMLRQRWNPFHPYLESRTLSFFELTP